MFEGVREALFSLPFYFESETHIEGIAATDIFTFNTALGATIENQVVSTLNKMRNVWDPTDTYQDFAFVRQPQTFPDVLLRRITALERQRREDILLGIELKGWYLLAKEAEPSFRFRVTPSACSQADLIAVVPWALGYVISGSPILFRPYVELARYAAEYRNYHWQNVRITTGKTEINSPTGITPYPTKTESITDQPSDDTGGNFGRFARTGIMDDYLGLVRSQQLCGIPASHWLSFFKLYQEQGDPNAIAAKITALKARLATEVIAAGGDTTTSQELLRILDSVDKIHGSS